jgi:hypothetical protein
VAPIYGKVATKKHAKRIGFCWSAADSRLHRFAAAADLVMDITVKSFQGSYLVSGVEDGTTVAELKRMLHQQHSQAPEPDKQCLVRGTSLHCCCGGRGPHMDKVLETCMLHL